MKLGISYLIFGLFYVFHLEFGSRMLFVFVDVMLVTMQQSQQVGVAVSIEFEMFTPLEETYG